MHKKLNYEDFFKFENNFNIDFNLKTKNKKLIEHLVCIAFNLNKSLLDVFTIFYALLLLKKNVL